MSSYAVPAMPSRPSPFPRAAWLLLLLCAMAWLASAHAEDEFLAPDKAFAFSASMAAPDTVQINFKVARGYYMYRERFAFAASPEGAVKLGEPQYPAGEVKYDPTFDQNMEVYHQPLSIKLPVAPGGQAFTLTVTGQGCADKGICYPPMQNTVKLQPVSGGYAIASGGKSGGGLFGFGFGFSSSPDAAAAAAKSDSSGSSATPGSPGAPAVAGAAGVPDATGARGATNAAGPAAAGSASGAAAIAMASAPTAPSTAPGPAGLGDLANADDVGLAGAIAGMGWLRTAGVFLLLGVLLSLTPCVLPMIPILSSIVVGGRAADKRSRLGGLGLAAAYVLGMSLVYTALGVAAGLTGAGLAAWLQNPWVLTVFALVLALLALAMFDVFTLQVPVAMQSGLTERVSRIPGGRATGAFVMGAVSALIVGPCVAAPLAGALLYISQTRDVLLGGSALFAMAWGMGVPLLVVGASAGSLLPKAGAWMDGVKRLFGMLLLATAWWMLIPVLPDWLQMLGWAFLAIVGAVMLRAFEALPVAGGAGRMFGKGLGLLLALISVVLLVGAASGGRDVLQPLAQFAARVPASASFPGSIAGSAAGNIVGNGAGNTAGNIAGNTPGNAGYGALGAASGPIDSGLPFQRVRSVAELDALVAAAGRPVMLDFYADWCVSCREMEKFTFSDPAVAQRMSRMLLLRADVTANNADDQALLKRFKLYGPPGIMFYDATGRHLSDIRVIGFQDAGRFTQSLDRVVAR